MGNSDHGTAYTYTASRVEIQTGAGRSRANMAHIRHSRPDSGRDFQARDLKTFQVVPSSLGTGVVSSSSIFMTGNPNPQPLTSSSKLQTPSWWGQ